MEIRLWEGVPRAAVVVLVCGAEVLGGWGVFGRGSGRVSELPPLRSDCTPGHRQGLRYYSCHQPIARCEEAHLPSGTRICKAYFIYRKTRMRGVFFEGV